MATLLGRVWQPRLAGNTPLAGLNYPKTAPFTGNRLLAAGWIGHAGWGGDLLFRELVQFADGSLGTKFLPEMIPRTGRPLPLAPESLRGETNWQDGRLRLAAAGEQEAAARVAQVPADARIRLQVEPQDATLCLALTDAAGKGVRVHLDPVRRRVAITGPLDRAGAGAEPLTLQPVSGLDCPFALDLIVTAGIVDLCVDGRYTLVARRLGPAVGELCLSARGGTALISQIEVCSIADL